MQQRWERWLDRAEQEAPMARAHAQAYERGREDAARPATMPAESTDPMGTRMDMGSTTETRITFASSFRCFG